MVKILLVGLGGMGNVHFSNYTLIDDCEVIASVGQGERDLGKSREWGIPMYASIDEACKNENIDVIDICTPTYLHYDNVMSALSNNKHVICEKPLTLNSIEASRLFETANSKHCHIYVAHVVQFMPEIQYLRSLVKSKEYGKPLTANFKRLSSMPSWGSNWMFDRNKAGLIPYDLHIHDLDVIVSLFGVPQSVLVRKSQGILEFPEYFRFMYDYENLNVMAEASWFNAKIPFTVEWSVYFEKAFIVYDGDSVHVYPENGKPKIKKFEDEMKIETGINVSATAMYYNELKHFIDCIKAGIATPVITDQQVMAVLETLDKISREY